ncbi:MAG: TadE-like protein [Aeromicrobium sp.]|jgi:Flp pilus assembly protein TadG|uniref:TadE/TadG family type IV pilus assembly protein n=1 Tax=Aeromicrobium sp. TaxID=1871063 RepID=UPI00262516DF|nr:TadE/TadG family type IV pilus assembly protein [Aeromicrobium sp.]MCW2790387.1 TadE-like protein [Aeromicrobium sp.]MCW2824434.1 TadE-like protein [Aeromicrobium sp.]
MRSRQRRQREEGTSAIELVLYMPLLMVAIILTVQFALVYLGNQAVSAAAREAARTARVTGDAAAGQARGYDYARDLGRGLLARVDVQVDPVDDNTQMRAVVSADGEQLLPFIRSPRLSEEVQGPIEQFIEDDG